MNGEKLNNAFLDTCALLWLAHDQTKIPKETLEIEIASTA